MCSRQMLMQTRGGKWYVEADGGCSQSDSWATNGARGGRWLHAPEPHQVPLTKLGKGRRHQSCQAGTHAEKQPQRCGRWAPKGSPDGTDHMNSGQLELEHVLTRRTILQAQDWSCSGWVHGEPTPEQGTTIIVWNLPEELNLAGVLKLWPVDGTFNYLEVPFSASEKRHKGRALFNFVSEEAAMLFVSKWNRQWLHPSQKAPLEIRQAQIQGIQQLLFRFQGKDIDKLDHHGCLPLICDHTLRLNTKSLLTMLFQS